MNVLLYAPSGADRNSLAAIVSNAGHEVVAVDCPVQGGAKLPEVELTLVDLTCADALKFLRKYASSRDRAGVVCVADRRQPELSSEALRLGIADIVARPMRADDLLAAIANAVEMRRLIQRAEPIPEICDSDEGVFGASPAMRDILGVVRRVAHSRCGVLLVGERGTGREMIARTIHAHGPRRDRPFVKILCGEALSPELDKLLTTGAPAGATVYLEDIGELSHELQLRLEARVRPGSDRSAPSALSTQSIPSTPSTPDLTPAPWRPSEREVEPRFVAGALPRVNDYMDRGQMRRTLVEALAVVRVDLPSLRQRSQDIPLLATHFLKEACRSNDIPAKTFSRSAQTLLSALPWPGNAAELRSLAERLAVLIPRGVVLLEDVLGNVRLDGAEAMGRPRESLKDARERFERDYVTSVLQHHKGRMGIAARELGIERTNLYRKIRQLNIRWTLAD